MTQVKIGGIEASTAPMEELQRYVLTKYYPSPFLSSRLYSFLFHTRDKLVIEIRSKLNNIPAAECFEVEARWEVLSCGINSCYVTASTTCHFYKSVLLQKQILNSTIKQTRNSYGKWVILAQDVISALPPRTKKKSVPAPAVGTAPAPSSAVASQKELPSSKPATVPKPNPSNPSGSSNFKLIFIFISCFVLLLALFYGLFM